MLLKVLRAKIHRATVTAAAPDYVGSITIDMDLADAVGIVPGEFVLVGDLSNGERFETYVMPGERGGGPLGARGRPCHHHGARVRNARAGPVGQAGGGCGR